MIAHSELHMAHLFEAPHVLPTLERWFVAEWTPWYGPGGQGDARADLAQCQNRDALPLCLVALNGAGDVLGTAALRPESVGSELGVGPWLAALLVPKEHQNCGIGTALVAAIEAEATRLGFASIYTSTDTAGGLLQRRGWRVFGAARSLRGSVTVYRWQAPDPAPMKDR